MLASRFVNWTVVGRRLIRTLTQRPVFEVRCADDGGHSTVVVWDGNAGEQLGEHIRRALEGEDS